MRNVLIGLVVGGAVCCLLYLTFLRGAEPPTSSPQIPGTSVASAANEPTVRGSGPGASTSPSASTPPLQASSAFTLTTEQLVEAARRDRHGGPGDPGTLLHKPGQLSVDAVKAGIDAAKPGITDCYEQALKSSPELSGKLAVEFVVQQHERKGRLKEARIDDEQTDEALKNPFLGMCVLKALGEVEYAAPVGEGEVVVRYPFRLDPGTPDTGKSPTKENLR